MRRSPWWSVPVVAVVGVCLVVGGCGTTSDEPGVGLTFDEEFEDALFEAVEGHEAVELRDLTDFEWDTVSVFGEATPAERAAEETGANVVDGSYYTNSRALLVFCANHEVVARYAYAYPNLRFRGSTFSNEVILEDGAFVEPSGDDVEAACAPD